MGKLLKKVGDIVSNIILGLIIAVLVVVLILRAGGIELFSVRTGSMYPTYPVGSIILVYPTDFSQLSVGDVITFTIEGNTTVTHRIHTINNQSKTIITKGDNNNTPDKKSINANDILGKVVFSIPYLGYISVFADTIYGKITIFAIALFVVAMVVYNFINAIIKKRLPEDTNGQEN